jgi:hypothetical protein
MSIDSLEIGMCVLTCSYAPNISSIISRMVYSLIFLVNKYADAT